MEYITIAEYAERANISKQTAYNRANSAKYKSYFQKVDGVLKVDISIFETKEDSNIQSNFQGVETLTKKEEMLFSVLQKQIDQQNKQIENLFSLLAEKDKTIMRLTESTNTLIGTVQALQHERNLLEAGKLEAEKVPPPVEPPEDKPIVKESRAETPKKGLFARFRRR